MPSVEDKRHECDRCGALTPVSEIVPVRLCPQTYSSPAEYEGWCRGCLRPDDVDEDYERAAARYDGEGKDWR